MERDPETRTERERAAAGEAAATAAGEGEATDGVHGTAGTDEVPVAPADTDGTSEPEAGAAPARAAPAHAAGTSEPGAGAAAASVAQATDDAPAPEPEPKPAEPDYKDQYLRAMAELDNVRKRARGDVSQAEARGV